jgi:hypothetical protein
MKKALLSLTTLCTLGAHANEFHYENFPVGDTPSALAGAYSASHGKTFSMHYNPAGIADIGKQISGTLNAFSSTNTKFEEVFTTPVGVEFAADERIPVYHYDSLDRSSNTIVPGFLGYTMPLSKLTIGAYLSTPDLSYEQLSDTDFFDYEGDINIYTTDGSGFVTEAGAVYEERGISLDSEYNVTQGGISAAVKISPKLSLGTTLGVISSKRKEIYITTQFLTESSDVSDYQYTQSQTETTRIKNEETLVEPKLGLLWQGDGFSFGLNASKKISLSRDFSYNANFLTSIEESSSTHNLDLAESNLNEVYTIQASTSEGQEQPLNIDLGVQKFFDWGSVSLDIHHYFEVDQEIELVESRRSSIQPELIYVETSRQYESVTNFSAAVNYKFSPSTSLYLGAFTDLSNTKIRTHEEGIAYLAHEDIDLFGISTAINYKTEEYDITAGVVASTGSGKAASWELIAFGGGHNEGEEDYYEIDRTAWNAFLGVQF